TRQRYGKDSFRNIGQVLRCKFSSSSISDSTFHFSIASPRCAVKNGAVSPASKPLEGKAVILFICRQALAICYTVLPRSLAPLLPCSPALPLSRSLAPLLPLREPPFLFSRCRI